MKSGYQSANFGISIPSHTFEEIKESARSTGKGFHRAIKDYLRVTVFPFMEVGDYTFIKGVVEKEDLFEVMLHLNKRLLSRVHRCPDEWWVAHVCRPLPVGPGECPPGGTERATANAEEAWPPLHS